VAQETQIGRATTATRELRVRVLRLQWLTVAWMTVEAAVALFSALRAHSVALAAFGGDSAIELLSASVVLWRFRAGGGEREALSSRITAVLLVALAVFIAADSVFTLAWAKSKPAPSYLGMCLLVVAAVVMPWLARRKRELSEASGSAALKADSVQSSVCGYLAWIALAGLGLNAAFGISWADPVAALALVPLVVKEAAGAMRGEPCDCA
jgi:divalent metal cation (Fe/Co/Zn/Cd) transporter